MDILTSKIDLLKSSKIIAVNIETDGINPHENKIQKIQLATSEIPSIDIDFQKLSEKEIDLIREILSTSAVKVFYNSKFSLKFLEAINIFPEIIFDCILASQLIDLSYNYDDLSLENLTKKYLKKDLNNLKITEIILELREKLVSEIVKNNLTKVAEIEFQCVRAIANIEYKGIYLDKNKWQKLLEKTTEERNKACEKLCEFVNKTDGDSNLLGDKNLSENINFDSPKFVLGFLKANGLKVKATAKNDLYKYRDNPIVIELTNYRKASKSISSFLEPIPLSINEVTGRIHSEYEQLIVVSGRMACRNPNIQQIPRDKAFRECFTAEKGNSLIIADYSQIELRVAAQISGDKKMIEGYKNNIDLHALTASYLTGKPIDKITKEERQAYKAANLGLIYGMGARGLQRTSQQDYGVEITLDEAKKFYDGFFKTYEGIAKWHENIMKNHKEEGRTLTGRRVVYSKHAILPEISNLPVQGTAADIIKKALGLLINQLIKNKEGDVLIVAVIHDEILLECPTNKAEKIAKLLEDTMENAANSILPDVPTKVKATISDSWAGK